MPAVVSRQLAAWCWVGPGKLAVGDETPCLEGKLGLEEKLSQEKGKNLERVTDGKKRGERGKKDAVVKRVVWDSGNYYDLAIAAQGRFAGAAHFWIWAWWQQTWRWGGVSDSADSAAWWIWAASEPTGVVPRSMYTMYTRQGTYSTLVVVVGV